MKKQWSTPQLVEISVQETELVKCRGGGDGAWQAPKDGDCCCS